MVRWQVKFVLQMHYSLSRKGNKNYPNNCENDKMMHVDNFL